VQKGAQKRPPQRLLAMTIILVSLRVCLQSHVTLLRFQRQPPSTSAVFATAPSTPLHNYMRVSEKALEEKERAFCSRESLATPSTPIADVVTLLRLLQRQPPSTSVRSVFEQCGLFYYS
jgi:hypothetical protein